MVYEHRHLLSLNVKVNTVGQDLTHVYLHTLSRPLIVLLNYSNVTLTLCAHFSTCLDKFIHFNLSENQTKKVTTSRYSRISSSLKRGPYLLSCICTQGEAQF